MRNYYAECGQVTHHQILFPEHLITQLFKSNTRTNGKTPRDHQNDPRLQIKILLPRLGKKNQAIGLNLQKLHQIQRINNCQIRPKMINNTEHVLGPEDILEIDTLPNLPNSAGYQNIVTLIDVFSRYLFAYPTQNVRAKTIERCIVDVITRHAYYRPSYFRTKDHNFAQKPLQK